MRLNGRKLLLLDGNVAAISLEHARNVLWELLRRDKMPGPDFETLTSVERKALELLLHKTGDRECE